MQSQRAVLKEIKPIQNNLQLPYVPEEYAFYQQFQNKDIQALIDDISRVGDLFNQELIEPGQVLLKLIDSYLKGPLLSFSFLSFLKHTPDHEDLAKRMRNHLHAQYRNEEKEESEISKSLLFALQELNETTDQFKPQDNFFKLLRGFFSVYSVYLAYITHADLKKQLSVFFLPAELFFAQVIEAKYNKFQNSKAQLDPSWKEEIEYSQAIMLTENIDFISIKQGIAAKVSQLINFVKTNEKLAPGALDSLQKMAKCIPDKQKEESLVMPLLELMKNTENNSYQEIIWRILVEFGQELSVKCKKEILHSLTDVMQLDSSLDARPSSKYLIIAAFTTLCEKAKEFKEVDDHYVKNILFPIVVKKIIPLLSSGLYAQLGKLAYLVTKDQYDNYILPVLLDSAKTDVANLPKMYIAIVEADKIYSHKNEKENYASVILAAKKRAQEEIASLLYLTKKPENLSSKIVDDIKKLIPLLDGAQLQIIILPFIFEQSGKGEADLPRCLCQLLASTIQLMGDKISLDLQKKSVEYLFFQIEKMTASDSSRKWHEPLGYEELASVLSCIVTIGDNKHLLEIANKLLSYIDFKSEEILLALFRDRNCDNNPVVQKYQLRNTINEGKLNCLAVVIPALDVSFIQKNILPYALEAGVEKTEQVDDMIRASAYEPTYVVLQESLKKMDSEYLKKKLPDILKAFLHDFGSNSQHLIGSIKEIIGRALSYPERIYCVHFVAKRINHYSLHNFYVEILADIYQLNRKDMEKIANKPKPVFYSALGV